MLVVQAPRSSGRVLAALLILVAGLSLWIARDAIVPPAAALPATMPTTAPTLAAGLPVVVPVRVTAGALVDAFEGNEMRAQRQYGGVLADVSGVVRTVGRDEQGQAYVDVEDVDGVKVRCARCQMSRWGMSRVLRLERGQSVTVRGQVDRMDWHVRVRDCALVQARDEVPSVPSN